MLNLKKNDKVDAILNACEKFGKIDSATIYTHALNKMGVSDSDYPASSFKRHLKELVDSGKISIEEDGNRFLYFIEELAVKIVGEALLKNIGGAIDSPNFLSQWLSLHDGQFVKSLSEGHSYLFYEMNGHFHVLKIQNDSLPLTLHFSRIKEYPKNLGPSEIREKLNNKRMVFLQFPVSRMSGVKSEEFLGHGLIHFSGNEVQVHDLKSTNGVFVRNLNKEEAIELIRVGLKSNQDTMTKDWRDKTQVVDIKTVSSGSSLTVNQYSLINFSPNATFLLIQK